MPCSGNVGARYASQRGKPCIGKSHGFQPLKGIRVSRDAMRAHIGLGIDDGRHPFQEPHIPAGDLLQFVKRHAVPDCLCNAQNAERHKFTQPAPQRVITKRAVRIRHRDFVKAAEAGFHRPQRFLQAFLKGPADGHGLTHRLHRGGQFCIRPGKFLEGEARDLGDDIIDRRLKACRGHAGDIIGQFVQRIADSQLGRDLGNGKPGCL
ncbi:MAG: Uncharacterised protein [SAR116 cluster bacterium]|nr:MAG: Uncharacterised protein [SAR116 cluster bacterium]